jgi:hypothetical protein
METKWILTGIVLICAIISAVVIIAPSMNTPAAFVPQGSSADFILDKELPKSPATAPSYNVIKKESVFEGSAKLMTVKNSIPSKDQAVPITEKILDNYGGLPKDAILAKVEQVFLEKYNTETKTAEERYPQFTQVIYEQEINGAPVIGPGADINICLGENGEMLQIEKAWRHVEYAGDIPVISATDAYEKLKKVDLLVIPQSSLEGVRISEIKLGYYAEDREHDQKIYSPVWIFYGYKQGGQPFPYMVDARQS